MTDNTDIRKDLPKAEAHVCCMSSDYYHCLNCKRFDPNYHYGYCDYHKADTDPENYCSDFWGK